MILGIYATLGVFLVIASRNPLAHRRVSKSRNACFPGRNRMADQMVNEGPQLA